MPSEPEYLPGDSPDTVMYRELARQYRAKLDDAVEWLSAFDDSIVAHDLPTEGAPMHVRLQKFILEVEKLLGR